MARPRRERRLDQCESPLDARVRVLDVPALPIEPLPLGTSLNRLLLWRNAWRKIERFASASADVFKYGDNCVVSNRLQDRCPCGESGLIVGVGRPSAFALAALRRLRPDASFFDAMDNFPEFYRGLSRRAMRRHEDAVADEVDLVIASSTFLADKFASRGLRVETILNACAMSEKKRREGERGRLEDDSANSAFRPPPSAFVLGYVGCIGRWFDWPLVLRLAEELPQARIELVGPCEVEFPDPLPPNVRMLPACKQSDAAAHLARFSAGLIPFRNNALTAGVDPIKYYDYRAAGLPVLSTRFGEMALRGPDDGVYFLDQTDSLAEAVSAALDHDRNTPEISRFRRNNDWNSRFRGSDDLRSLMPASRIRRTASVFAMDGR